MIARGRKNFKILAPFKNRRIFGRQVRPLSFGYSGLRILSRAFFPLRQIHNVIIWSKRFLLRRRWRRQFIWMRGRALLPITRKRRKTRMGKGKGRLCARYAVLYAGYFYIEVRWFSFFRVYRYFSIIKKKLSFKTKIVTTKQYTYKTFVYRNRFYRATKTFYKAELNRKAAALWLEGRPESILI